MQTESVVKNPPAREKLSVVQVASDLHRELKVQAVQRGMTMREFIEPVLRNLAMGAQAQGGSK